MSTETHTEFIPPNMQIYTIEISFRTGLMPVIRALSLFLPACANTRNEYVWKFEEIQLEFHRFHLSMSIAANFIIEHPIEKHLLSCNDAFHVCVFTTRRRHTIQGDVLHAYNYKLSAGR